MNSMGDNASTSPPGGGTLDSKGPNTVGVTSAPLVNAVNTSNDTQGIAVGEGTTEADLSIWRQR